MKTQMEMKKTSSDLSKPCAEVIRNPIRIIRPVDEGKRKLLLICSFICFLSYENDEYDHTLLDDEYEKYEKFIRRMNPPRVVVDNDSCKNATVIQVDSANKHGILLEVVQVLTDLNLTITKAYISSDGGWFMDVDEGIRGIIEEEFEDDDEEDLDDDEDPEEEGFGEEEGFVGVTPQKRATVRLKRSYITEGPITNQK